MSTFTEGDLQFAFPDNWGVRAYDDHTYYKGLSGIGLKGVDFIAIDPSDGGHLYVIEVKNYRTRITKDGQFVATLKPAQELVQVLKQKHDDSLKAIQAIHQYYHRNWLFRLLERRVLKSQYFSFDRVFWSQAFHLSILEKRTTFVLWIDLEESDTPYLKEVEDALNRAFTPKIKVKLVHGQLDIVHGLKPKGEHEN